MHCLSRITCVFLSAFFCTQIVGNPCKDPDPLMINGTFPGGFIWSVATASYQVEGGWQANGKGKSIWDTFCHQTPNPVIDNGTGDVACDSYHKWQDDIELLKNLGVKYYRFSLSWGRILPNGFLKDGINLAGVRYYRNLINGLHASGIEPMITLYHWDLPQALEDAGGWLNPQSPDWFAKYASTCFSLLGQKVKYWITINEPMSTALEGYGYGNKAPQISHCPGTCPYIVAHNQIKAHAKAWRLYDKTYRQKYKGKVGISISSDGSLPGTENAKDLSAAERNTQFQLGWFAHPIFVNGDYPPVMKSVLANRSKEEGRPHSRLPQFSNAEKLEIAGTWDFFGLNTYMSRVIYDGSHKATPFHPPDYEADKEVRSKVCGSWKSSGSEWLKSVPWGTRVLLNWVKQEYGNPPVIITENGWSDNDGSLNDTSRVEFYQQYINNVLKAIVIDGCNVSGYTAWSLMDNFEWDRGYSEKFGLHFVNFSDPGRPRTPKLSAYEYAKIIRNNGFPVSGAEDANKAIAQLFLIFILFVCVSIM